MCSLLSEVLFAAERLVEVQAIRVVLIWCSFLLWRRDVLLMKCGGVDYCECEDRSGGYGRVMIGRVALTPDPKSKRLRELLLLIFYRVEPDLHGQLLSCLVNVD